MTGKLTIIGLGPGASEQTTPAVSQALAAATDLVGYGPYLERTSPNNGQRRHPSGNRVEIERAQQALELAQAGNNVVVVSSGDPGVFAMAAAVFEAIEKGPREWRALDVQVEPGITAMLSAAAHVGAPLGSDFCAISISDNLKSWQTIEKRLRATASADFVIALYNPASKARPHQFGDAIKLLRDLKPPQSIVSLVRAAGTQEVKATSTTLAKVDTGAADMRTLVIVGSTRTKKISRSNGSSWIYTPRSETEVA